MGSPATGNTIGIVSVVCLAAIAKPRTIGFMSATARSARAQQPAMPVIGFVGSDSPDLYADRLRAFRLGLKVTGFIEGQSVATEYRWAEGRNDRLPALTTDLLRRQVAVIVAPTTHSALAAKAATETIPIVFFVAGDPVELGLVTSRNRPGGNLTGATTLTLEVGAKRLELLHEMVPTATIIGLLVNPTSPNIAEAQSRDLQIAGRALGLQVHVLSASTDLDFDTVFANVAQLRAGGLVISSDSFFFSRSEQLAALAARHAVPAIYGFRESATAGGLIRYGGSLTESFRWVGIYTGRILKGDKPGDLPVQQSTKLGLIINLKGATAIGLEFPAALITRADDVIE
jgi:putative tryptophan/tyrosine transport system substrate-binding protein